MAKESPLVITAFRISKDELAVLQKIAAKSETNVSILIRKALQNHFRREFSLDNRKAS